MGEILLVSLMLLGIWLTIELLLVVGDNGEAMANLIKTVWGLLGRKQWIGVYVSTLSLFIASVGVWLSESATVVDLLAFLKWWMPGSLTAITVPAMVTDSVRARNGAGKEKE